jgi:hypothetical protein
MDYRVRGKQQMLTWLPERHRRTLCLMQSARRCRVSGYLEQGVRPHINLFGVRYTAFSRLARETQAQLSVCVKNAYNRGKPARR